MLSSRNTTIIGTAIAKSEPRALTRFVPNDRNTPATIAITMGMGSASMTRRTRPVTPNTVISAAVTKNAPTTSAQLRCVREPPTRIVPGMVQKKPSGCR